MTRTSIALPEELLAALQDRWPGLSQSEAIRLALERHEFLMSIRQNHTAELIQKHSDTLAAILGDFEFDDFKIACRAMPSLIESYLELEPHGLPDDVSGDLEDYINADLHDRERLYLLDAAINYRDGRRLTGQE